MPSDLPKRHRLEHNNTIADTDSDGNRPPNRDAFRFLLSDAVFDPQCQSEFHCQPLCHRNRNVLAFAHGNLDHDIDCFSDTLDASIGDRNADQHAVTDRNGNCNYDADDDGYCHADAHANRHTDCDPVPSG